MRLEPIADLEAAREDWTRLGEASGNLFSTWEWATVWWRHLGGGRPLHLVSARDDSGAVAAILPFYLARARPLRMLRFVGDGPADRLEPLCAPGDRPLAAAALRRALDERLAGWHVAKVDRLPGEEGWPELLEAPVFRTEPSPVLVAEGRDWDAFVQSRSKNFRDQVRRRERKLGKAHELTYRLTTDPDELERDYATLVRLHRERWGEESSSFAGVREALHLDFARAALGRGWLRLWTLELDGRPAAAWLGFRFGGAEWYYQAGRDPALEREAVGFVLMAHTIREALNDGVSEYRLLLGGEAYKDRFATADHGLETVVWARGARGRAAVTAA
ncbi:MAG TPA: GNAT family N-acetyltransferase, partial [Thermoleophilaceae bacterium]|nr:GNAT family N-acetyltransferase [Thermoleophilaceae bacterium]